MTSVPGLVCRLEIRLHDDPAGDQASSLTGNQVDFDSRTGAAVFTALRVSLPAVSAVSHFAIVVLHVCQVCQNRRHAQ